MITLIFADFQKKKLKKRRIKNGFRICPPFVHPMKLIYLTISFTFDLKKNRKRNLIQNAKFRRVLKTQMNNSFN